jgi:hypothetical protein
MIEAAEACCPFGDMELAIQMAIIAAPNPPKTEEAHHCALNMIMDGTCSVCGKTVEQ